MAIMLDALETEKGMKVLEIGTGTGYNAALLAQIVGDPRKVYSIENQADIASESRVNLQRADCHEVNVVYGDGGYGYPQPALRPDSRLGKHTRCASELVQATRRPRHSRGSILARIRAASHSEAAQSKRRAIGTFCLRCRFRGTSRRVRYDEQREGWICAGENMEIAGFLERPIGEDSSLLSDDIGNAVYPTRIDDLVMFVIVCGGRPVAHVMDRKRMIRLSLWDKKAKSLVCVWHPDLEVVIYSNDSACQQLRGCTSSGISSGSPAPSPTNCRRRMQFTTSQTRKKECAPSHAGGTRGKSDCKNSHLILNSALPDESSPRGSSQPHAYTSTSRVLPKYSQVRSARLRVFFPGTSVLWGLFSDGM